MIEIKDKHKCVGCKACNIVCPKDCISFNSDNEGFIYPLVDKALCIKCGKCNRVCPVINKYGSSLPIETYAAKSNDENIIRRSSSGGVFYSLAKDILDKGGVVFGAKFNDGWNIVYDYCESEQDLEPFLGSKYAQADVGNSFIQVKEFLEIGRYVLYVGTPCYIAALRRYLKRDYDKILLVDFICHGIPSSKVWSKFRDVNINSEDIKAINFRDKANGWRQYSLSFENMKAQKKIIKLSDNLYQKALISNLILRPSCYKCPAKEFRSMSDITLGDFWGVDKVMKRKDDDTGISLVMVNSEKGKGIISELISIVKEVVKYSDALIYNARIIEPTHINKNRNKFFKNIDDVDILHNLTDNLKYSFIDKKLHKLRLKVYTFKRFLHLRNNKPRL